MLRKSKNEIYREQPWISTYWRFLGLYPNEEVWLMTEAERKDCMKDKLKEEEGQVTHGISKFLRSPEEAIVRLDRAEVKIFKEVLDLLDYEYDQEMTEIERLYYALEYVRYVRWVQFAFAQGEGELREAHVAYEKLVGTKMAQFFKRMDDIRQEKRVRIANPIDMKAELIEEEATEVKKVAYKYKATAAESDSNIGNEGSNQRVDE